MFAQCRAQTLAEKPRLDCFRKDQQSGPKGFSSEDPICFQQMFRACLQPLSPEAVPLPTILTGFPTRRLGDEFLLWSGEKGFHQNISR